MKLFGSSIFGVCSKIKKHTYDDDGDVDVDGSLPHEIILNILGRVPVECLADKTLEALRASRYLVEMHLARVTPIVAFQHKKLTMDSKGFKGRISFIDDKGKVVIKNIQIDYTFEKPGSPYMLTLVGSYDGFLMFRHGPIDGYLHVFNPITEEQVTIMADDFRICGFYFHPTTAEYRLLLMDKRSLPFQFYVYGLRTKCFRWVATFSHPPHLEGNQIMANGALHWRVESYLDNHNRCVSANASNYIVSFNIHTEKFSIIPVPPSLIQYCKVFYINFTEMEGRLCICVVPNQNRRCIHVWILEDHQKHIWVKTHDVPTDAFEPFNSSNLQHP